MAMLKWKRASYPEAPSELDSLNLFERFQDDWDRIFGWSRFPEASGLYDGSVSPSIDVVETEQEVVVWADVPGLDKKDLELSMAGNVLTLKGEKVGQQKSNNKDDRVYRDETWSGSFHRSLSLPDSVDPNQVFAEFRDGVLKVTIAKRPEHKPRQIPVAVR